MKYIVALIPLIFFTSLSKSIAQKDCKKKIDTLSRVLTHIKYGVFDIDLQRFSIDKYKNMSVEEFRKKEISNEEKYLRFLEFELFVEYLFEDKNCICEWSRQEIINVFGETEIANEFQEDLRLKLYFDNECPCKKCVPRETFGNCSSLYFIFDANKCLKKVFTN